MANCTKLAFILAAAFALVVITEVVAERFNSFLIFIAAFTACDYLPAVVPACWFCGNFDYIGVLVILFAKYKIIVIPYYVFAGDCRIV